MSCGGPDEGSLAPIGVVSTVTLSSNTATLQVGQTVTLTAAPFDARGNAVANKATLWGTSNPSVAVVASGVVTAVAAGIATITATVDSKIAQATVTVTTPCAIQPLALGLGEIRTLTGTQRSTVCIDGGTAGGEYVIIPFKGDTSSLTVPLSFSSTSTDAVTSPTAAARLAAAPAGAMATALRGRDMTRQQAFERYRRVDARAAITAGMRQNARLPRLANIVGLPATPTVGSTVAMNVNVSENCTNPKPRKARVAAVSKNAVILADTAAPANGFTDADFASFATTFDTLIYPLDTTAFGAPTDIDGNGRIVVFFTPAVNALTKAGDPGYIAGFFMTRDIFPVTAPNPADACGGSNFAEMFYMPVPDPTKSLNPFFSNKDSVKTNSIATLAHEMEHLINDTHRQYVTNAGWEEVWLDEGLAHLAEELLFLRASGFQLKSDFTLQALLVKSFAVNTYQVGNLSNFYDYLQSPEVHSAFAQNDIFETRGAGWSLLRYAIDQGQNAPETYTRALLGTSLYGMSNFNSVFVNAVPGGLLAATRQMAIANYTDDSGLAVDAKYSYLSWNFRDVLAGFSPGVYPLLTRALTPTKPAAFPIVGGGAAYMRFGVAAGITASVNMSSGPNAVPATVELIVIRTK